jgi:hypothetical protein
MDKQTDPQHTHKMTNTFPQRVENITNITFTNDVMQLLEA